MLPEEGDDIIAARSLSFLYGRCLTQADAVTVLANEFPGTWPKGETDFGSLKGLLHRKT